MDSSETTLVWRKNCIIIIQKWRGIRENLITFWQMHVNMKRAESKIMEKVSLVICSIVIAFMDGKGLILVVGQESCRKHYFHSGRPVRLKPSQLAFGSICLNAGIESEKFLLVFT